MKAYPTLGFLLSSGLLFLTACGTSILGGGTSGSGASGSGGGGAGGACVQSPGDHTISLTGFSRACTQASDCTPVYAGDACTECGCPNAAIANSAFSAYNAEEVAKSAGCCNTGICACPEISASCQQGLCVAGGAEILCNGKPSPVSCTDTSCPSGFTCTPDPDPTTCHPSSCTCDGSGDWACTADCGMNGSTCYKGL